MSKAIEAGLYHPRCRDVHSTYFEFLEDDPDDTYSREEITDIEKQYAKEQKLLYAVRQAEKFERLAKYSLASENIDNYLAKKEKWDARVSDTKLMRLSIPDDIYEIHGMTEEVKGEIERAIVNLQNEYLVSIDSIEVGPMGKGDLFGSGPYLDDKGKMKFGLVLNENIDYNKVVKRIDNRYKKRYFAGKSIEDYIAHEMAHIMTYQDCQTERNPWRKRL